VSNDPDDPVVLLDKERIDIEPGGEARISVSVRNPTTIVEEYAVEILGPAAAWGTVEPPRLNVMPGSNATTTVVLSPPRVPPPEAGDTPFALRCVSQLDRSHSTVVEADVNMGGYKELLLQVAPTTSKGIGRGKHRVVLINRGNLADRVRLSATDSADELRFKFDRDIVDVPAMGQVEAKLTARPQATFLKGQPKQHRFEVAYGPILPVPGEEPETRPTAATYVQKPWLSPAIVALLALAAIIAVLVGVLMSMRDDPASRASEQPPVVAEFSSPPEASSIDAVRLAWNPVPDAQSYDVERLPATGSGAPVAEEVQTVSGERDNFVWTGLQPSTDYCFRVIAVTPAGRSEPSPSTCAKTLDQAPFGPPSNLQAVPVAGTNSVQLSWTPSGPQATHVVFVDGVARAETVTGESTQFNVEPGLHTFEVAGVAADGSQTAKSNQQTIPVGPPPADTTVPTVAPTVAPTAAPTVASPTVVIPPGTDVVTTASTALPPSTASGGTTTSPPSTIAVNPGWMVILENIPSGDSDSLARAQARQQVYVENGFEVNLAPNDALGLTGPPSWTLYVDGMESEEAAKGLCQALRDRQLITPGQNCIIQDRTST